MLLVCLCFLCLFPKVIQQEKHSRMQLVDTGVVDFRQNKQLTLYNVSYLFSASAVDDLQMKELQDQLEAETYFSVKIYLIINASILIAQFYKDFAEAKTTDSVLEKK